MRRVLDGVDGVFGRGGGRVGGGGGDNEGWSLRATCWV